MDDRETHPAGTSGPYKPDSAQHQIDFYKLREGLALDHNMKLQDEIKDLRAHLLSERRQKDAAQARADLAEKRLAAAKAALTRANAATAAAYEVAAQVCENGDEFDPSTAIRALATPDQTAALDKLIAEVVKPYVALLERWQSLGCPNCNGDCSHANPPIYSCIVQETRTALLAASKKGGAA